MSQETLIHQIAAWHTAREHGKIREAVLALPEDERTDELVCLLARALSNMDDYTGALSWLDGIRDGCAENPYYCFRRGFALYCLHREDEALPWFQKAREKGLEDIDETPGTYYPKSVSKWLERAERRAPQRVEKNAFEEERRRNRNKEPLDTVLLDVALEGLWDDCDYSLKEYVGRVPADADFDVIEAELGVKLPASYKALMRRHNGGLVIRNTFENPLQRDWTPNTFEINGLYGVDRDKPYSLCGKAGSKFWISEWGYPDIGVAICDCPSGGHDMIFLDYSDCGPEGEPCIVHIDQESDYEITYLADDFASFVRGLTQRTDEEDEE
jgi:tetratricopeptide (TPR) repeat protein